jgi:hypothetical protein
MNPRYGCLVVLCLLAAGCAATSSPKPSGGTVPQGSSSWSRVEPTGTQHYQLSHDQVASGSLPLKRVSPVYPAAELTTCPPSVDVEAQLIVDKAGHVSDVRVAAEAQAGEQRRHYIDAVRTAAQQWQFQPLEIDHWVSDPGGMQHLENETQPFSEIYVFHFQCRNGQPSTTIGNAPAA